MNNLMSDNAVADLEMAELGAGGGLAGFFEEVGSIKDEMVKLEELLAKLREANEDSKAAHKASAIRSLRSQMELSIAEVLRLARDIKSRLQRLDDANAASRLNKSTGPGTPSDRTRVAITASLRSRLKSIMVEFVNLREKMAAENKAAVQRRYHTITGEDASEETIEHIIETGQSETLLKRAVQQQGEGTGRVQLIDTVEEITARRDAVKAIEASLLELHQVFLDMAVLVETQGEVLDNIEANVLKSASYVEKGRGQLERAKKSQRSSRKWTCIAIVLLLIIILVIVIPLVVKK